MSKPNKLLQEFEIISHPYKPPKVLPDIGICCNCNKKVKVEDCIQDYGYHNGHELPPYTEYVCPHCDDGAMGDWIYSDVQWEKYMNAGDKTNEVD